MAIQWGAWEGASPTRIRVGIDVSWSDPGHNASSATATVKYYTDVEGNWSDSQTLNFSGAIGGSVSFTNGQSNNSVLRATKSYTYDYGNNEYGSSPGSRTFAANLTGAWNGATPSKSVSSKIPARPYGAPAAPTSVSVSRASETSAKITWTNKSTSGEPWDAVRVQVDGAANDVWNGDVGTTGGGGTALTSSSLTLNALYKWRVRSENSVGDSNWVETSILYTKPDAPTIGANSAGATAPQRVISWTNGANSNMAFVTEVYVTRDGGATWLFLAEVSKATTSYTDTAALASQKTAYRVRHQTTGGVQGTLYSDFSADSSMTVGVTTPPNAPTSLSPANSLVVIPTQPKTFAWQYNSTDTTPQMAFQIQYRLVGGASWTLQAKVASGTSSTSLAANTFLDNSAYEWQVRTWGSATTGGSDGTGASAWSASATFKTIGDPNAARSLKRVVRLDLETGEMETAPVMVLPPIGSVLLHAGQAAPEGWILCRGQSLLRNDYPDLFAVIGTSYGAVDSTHFTVPDLRDRVPLGAGGAHAVGSVGGSSAVTLSIANMPAHNHGSSGDHDHILSLTGATGAGGYPARGQTAGSVTASSRNSITPDGAHTHTTEGSGSSFSVQNPFQTMNYIIKA